MTSTGRNRDELCLLFHIQTSKENPNGRNLKLFLELNVNRFSLGNSDCMEIQFQVIRLLTLCCS